jgi:5-methyltetrahydropteroyltriglutamate--homocysteine methyltransferase
MIKATKALQLPTTITGSLPRPVWYTENLGNRPFRDAIANARFREQYTDAVAAYLRDQERAGLDIVTDGDARFDNDVGGMSWFQYPARRFKGLAGGDYYRTRKAYGGTAKGDIIFEVMESRVMPRCVEKIERMRDQLARPAPGSMVMPSAFFRPPIRVMRAPLGSARIDAC